MPTLLPEHAPEKSLDELISNLISEDNITASKKEAEAKLSSLTSDQIKYLRKRAKIDLFFLSNSILGYDKLSENLHGDLCWWMMRNMRERFKIVLLPRSHYKSTIATISDSIRIALPDESNGLASWPECLGTNVRLLIAHETAEQAAKFLVSVTGHFLSNPMLMGLFPECVPNPRKHRINKVELELPRTEIWSEATFDTMGVGGKSQGRHYDYLKLDDLIGDKARDSKAEMQTAKDWIDNIQAFFTAHTRAKMDIIGTRWAFDDVYNHLFNMYGKQLLRYIRSAEERDPKTGKFGPIFPEQFTTESFEILKKNIKVWSAQYANNPAAGATELQSNWKRFYQWSGRDRLYVGDGQFKTHYHVMEDLDRCILIDPAMSGLAGFVVTGTTTDDKIFLLEAKKHAWKPPELVDYLFAAVARWQPRLVAIEAVLFSELFQHWIESEMQLRGVRFHVEPISTGGKKKEVRVRGLVNYASAGVIHYHGEVFQEDGEEKYVGSMEDFNTEWNEFGATTNYHLLDALAQGPQVWVRPYGKARWESLKAAEEVLLANRDPETGY